MNRDRIKLYNIDKDKESRLWQNAIFVFDSSALLDFYEIPKKTREKIYKETLIRLEGRLWIPSHVEFEYLKNRENTILKIERPYKNLKEKIKVVKDNFIRAVKNGTSDISEHTKNDKKHPHIEQNHISKFQKQINAFEVKLIEFEKNLSEQIKHEEEAIRNVAKDDDVLEFLEKYFVVGPEYTFERILEITEEGKHRYEFRIPPGYGDLIKEQKVGTQIFGDLIIWMQILQHAKEKKCPVIFITNDIKKENDWCYLDEKGDVKAPRPELVKEIYDFSKMEFWIYNLPQFLNLANDYLKSNISDDTINTIKTNWISKYNPRTFRRRFNDYDDMIRCHECDGNREDLGNFVHNWHDIDLLNQFPKTHLHGKFISVIAAHCDWCNTIHIKCPVCKSINSFPEYKMNENIECEGGCNSILMYKSDDRFENPGGGEVILVDDRLSDCVDCGKTFIDTEKNALCTECEEKRINN